MSIIMNNVVELPGTTVTNNFLSKVLDDYIENDNDCYEDLLRELEGKIKYHSDCLERASDLYGTLLQRTKVKTI